MQLDTLIRKRFVLLDISCLFKCFVCSFSGLKRTEFVLSHGAGRLSDMVIITNSVLMSFLKTTI